MEKGIIFQKNVNERGTFSVRMVYKKERGWSSGWSLPVESPQVPPGACVTLICCVLIRNYKKTAFIHQDVFLVLTQGHSKGKKT